MSSRTNSLSHCTSSSSQLPILGDVALATDDELLRVHDPAFIESVKLASEGTGYRDLARGLGTDDVPVFEGMHGIGAGVRCIDCGRAGDS